MANPSINVDDYSAFSNAVKDIDTLKTTKEEVKTAVDNNKTTLSDESIFKGPAATSVVKSIESEMTEIVKSFDKAYDAASEALTETAKSYKEGDAATAEKVINAGVFPDIKVDDVANVQYSRSIPSDIKQSGYTITGYATEGWQYTDYSTKSVAAGTNQEKVHDNWVKDGSRYKNGIAVTKVNGRDRYLIATSDYYGKVGDSVNVKLENGQTIPCVIADQKSNNDSNITKYGHSHGSGGINVLEFEVNMKKYKSSGNPNTSDWNLDWDSSSKVKSVDNLGSTI